MKSRTIFKAYRVGPHRVRWMLIDWYAGYEVAGGIERTRTDAERAAKLARERVKVK